MDSAMTLQEAKSIARHLGLTLRKVRSGDYRVNFRDGNETTAYYTDDLEDAVSAAVEKARKRGVAKMSFRMRFTEPQIALVMRAHPDCNLDRSKNCHPRHVRCALPHLNFFFKNAFRQKGYPLLVRYPPMGLFRFSRTSSI